MNNGEGLSIFFDGIIGHLQSSGGITTYFKELIERLPNNSYFWSGKSLNEKSLDDPNTLRLRRFERFRKALNHPNCIFHSSYYRTPAVRAPSVVTVHDFTHEVFYRGGRKLVHSYFKNRSIDVADTVICVSKNTALDLQKYVGVSDKKIRVIYNGVSKDFYPLEERGRSGSLLYVGSRASYKNFALCVKAVSGTSFKLKIVGAPLTSSETDYVETFLSPGQFSVESSVSNNRLNELYNEAFAFLYPSSYEGFGIPVIEAMRTGTPVVCLNASSIPEVAGDAGVYIDSASPDHIVDALKYLQFGRNWELHSELGKFQASKFSWDKCFDQTLKVYKELGF